MMDWANSATVNQVPDEPMVQLGKCFQRLITILADKYDPVQPFLFLKLDIKDGFWRLAVSNEYDWNFCYALPQTTPVTNIYDTLVVVTYCLQMVWFESPHLFCATSEMARDVVASLLQEVHLLPHTFED